jgi:hypothetical protein
MIKNKYPTTKPSLNLDFANTKSLDPRITFRRGTPGTYYDGVTHVKAEENLIKYSENFNDVDNYWAEVRATLTGSQASPIDSTSAYELSQTSTGLAGVLLVNENKIKLEIGKQYVSSVYVKASNSNYFAIAEEVSLGTGGPAFTYFDLSNDGEVMLNHENHIASIQNVGNQWYRCSIMFTAKLESDYTVMFYLDGGSSQSTISEPQNVTAGASIYLWGAQLEQRDSVTSYTATNGTPITKYQPKLMTASPDDARFDHDPNTGESKGLLIEESRTNLLTYSDLTSGEGVGTGWANAGSVVSKGSNVIAPDGTASAWNTVYNGTSGDGNLYKAAGELTTSNSTVYTCSVWAKVPSTNTYIAGVRIRTFNDNHSANFNLLTGTVVGTAEGTPTNRIEAYPNGWYRCSITFTSGTDGDQGFQFYLINNSQEGNSAILNSPDANGEELYLWGAQLEAGSFATSYIKTTGASATRSADNASITGENFSSWYRQDEGTLYYESSAFQVSEYRPQGVTLSDGTANNRVVMHAGTTAHLFITKNNTNIVDIDATQNNQDNVYSKKIACLKSNNFSVCIDGKDVGSDTTGETPIVDRMYISAGYAGNLETGDSSHVKKISYYPQRLTNEQLQNLTK